MLCRQENWGLEIRNDLPKVIHYRLTKPEGYFFSSFYLATFPLYGYVMNSSDPVLNYWESRNYDTVPPLPQCSRSVFSPAKSEAWTRGMLSSLLSDTVRVFILSQIEDKSKGPSGPVED